MLHNASLLGAEWQPEPPLLHAPVTNLEEAAQFASIIPCSDSKPLLEVLAGFMGVRP